MMIGGGGLCWWVPGTQVGCAISGFDQTLTTGDFSGREAATQE